MSMSGDRFVYVSLIRTTQERLWDALLRPEFTRTYWCGCVFDATWEPGSTWKMMIPDGRVADGGEVTEIDRPRKLVLTWRNEFLPELRADGYSRCTFLLEPMEDAVKLTVIHEIDKSGSIFIEKISSGWPTIISSLKSLLETGDALEATKTWPKNL
jgi:uncharacterized protein YndB with AHSA1/START domain